MVFFTSSPDAESIERDVLYSILDKDSKRAAAYWFLHVNVTNQPYDRGYSVETYGSDFMYFVNFNLGFKMDQRVNVYLRQVVSDLMESGELPKQNKIHSIYGPSPVGNFKFCMVRTTLPNTGEISNRDGIILSIKYAIRRAIGGKIKWYGLENSLVITEYVPLVISHAARTELIREK
jgi:KUP system potassium uptake protein